MTVTLWHIIAAMGTFFVYDLVRRWLDRRVAVGRISREEILQHEKPEEAARAALLFEEHERYEKVRKAQEEAARKAAAEEEKQRNTPIVVEFADGTQEEARRVVSPEDFEAEWQ